MKKITAYAPINGLHMYYEMHGRSNETSPLVLIHGGGSTIDTSFGTLIPQLIGYGKIIAVELQAHGRTSDRNAPESFEQDADDVAVLLKYLQISKAHILGFSNGGTTALQMAIRHPHVVDRIVVVAGAYRRDGFIPGFFEGFPNATLQTMPAALKDAFLKITPNEQKLQTMFEKDKQRMIDFKDLKDDDLKNIKKPALFIVNDRDVVTVSHTAQMAKLVTGGQLIVLPGYHGECIGVLETYKKGNKHPKIIASMIVDFFND